VVPLRCGSWECQRCAARMATMWTARVVKAKPERFVTYTRIGRDRHEVRAGLQHNVRDLRALGFDFQYWGVVELHKSGVPHMHCVCKGSYLPQDVVKDCAVFNGWGECTDIRQIRNEVAVSAYCVKHLCHSHGRRWPGRLIRYSRGFFPQLPVDATGGVKNDEVEWTMCFGRADAVSAALTGEGFTVEQRPLGDDLLHGEYKVRGECVHEVPRSRAMGYGLLWSDKLSEIVRKWNERSGELGSGGAAGDCDG